MLCKKIKNEKKNEKKKCDIDRYIFYQLHFFYFNSVAIWNCFEGLGLIILQNVFLIGKQV
jgi:hypothetical protein